MRNYSLRLAWAILETLAVLSTGAVSLIIPIDEPEPFVVDSFRVNELISSSENFQKLSAALRSNGLIAIQPDDSIDFSHARDVAFDRMCHCWSHDQHFLTAVQGTDSGLLSDGKTQRTTLGTATMGKTPLPLPDTLISTCGQDTVEALDYLRDHVSVVSDAFVSALDRLLQGFATGTTTANAHHQTPHLLRNSYGGTYPTLQSIVQASKHLEHFHVYSKPQQDDDPTAADQTPSMHVHTDAGLFLAFVPGQACENSSHEIKDNQSFYVKDAATGALRRAVFPPGSVAIMLGAGAEHWLQTSFPLAATRHTVNMPAGETRAWYGMMHLVPEIAYVQDEPLRTFDEMRQAMVLTREKMATRRFADLSGSDEDISIGCGNVNLPLRSQTGISSISPRRRLQHVEGPHSCNNSTNFFCWMSCLDIPDVKSAQGYLNEGYSLYCLDPSVLASSGNRVSEAAKACNENGKVGTAMNTNCMGKWEPTAPGVYAQEVIVQGAQNSDVEEPFCYGGTSMYMNGFNWVGTTCAIYLFPSWVLSSAGKLVAACLGSIFFGALMEYVIRLRREAMSTSSGPRYKRLALAAVFYGVQLTMGYSLMLVIMIYSVPLFISVILGLAGGHVLFNAKDSIIPARKVEGKKEFNSKAVISELKTATCCEGPCEEPCEQECCDGPCKGCCNDDDDHPDTRSDQNLSSNNDHGVPEGSTPCCQHTL